MLGAAEALETAALDPIDEALLPLLEMVECAVATRARIPVLSLWRRVPFVALLASHLHLKWPGRHGSLPLTPRIGIFPFSSADLDLLDTPLYHVQEAQTVRKQARSNRLLRTKHREDLWPPDWEQAIDRRRSKLENLILPASSFISIDRITETGDVKQGHRQVIGKLAPRGKLRPQLFIPVRGDPTRQLVRAFNDLDLVLVNAQNIRGKHLARSIQYFLTEVSPTVPMLIIASSPADLIAARALELPSAKPVILFAGQQLPSMSVLPVNHDRAIVERQFSYAIDGLAEKSEVLARIVIHAQRTWWAIRQSMAVTTPPEALAFETLYADIVARTQGEDVQLLEEAKRLILQESANAEAREERRRAVIQAALYNGQARTVLILARSDSAVQELKTALAASLEVEVNELQSLGIHIISAFSPWPSAEFDLCIATGYFGTGTIDMLFASRAIKNVIVADPIEARVAVWDVERRFCGVPDLPPVIAASLHSLSAMMEPHAAPSADAIHLQTLFGGFTPSRSEVSGAPEHAGKVTYVCICFTDGSSRQVAANARFEVFGRKRLQLQPVAAKDLQIGDQVILLQDDERAAFSDKLLRLMDQGRLSGGSLTRAIWLTTVRAVRSAHPVSASEIKKRLDAAGVRADLTTVRTWLPSGTSDDCGVPERESVFLALADALGVMMPRQTLKDWFAKINRLRIDHRRIGRELAKAIRGAYFGRLDPVTVARMEREWGVQAKALLDAVRVAVVDDVVLFTNEAS